MPFWTYTLLFAFYYVCRKEYAYILYEVVFVKVFKYIYTKNPLLEPYKKEEIYGLS